MKRGLKIAIWLCIAIFAVIAAGVIALQSPSVQTGLARKAVAQFTKNQGFDVEVGSLEIVPFNTVIIKDLVAIDKNPYQDRIIPGVKLDTVLHIAHASIRFSLKGLFESKGVHVSRVEIEGGQFALSCEEYDERGRMRSNITRFFPIKDDPEPLQYGDIFDADRITVKNFRYRMTSYVLRRQQIEKDLIYPDDAIDFSDFDLNIEMLKASHVKHSNAVTTGKVDTLSISEKSGEAIQLTAKSVNVGHGKADIRDAVVKDRHSILLTEQYRMDFKDLKSFNNYIEEVKMTGKFRPGTILDLQTIAYFAPTLSPMSFRAKIDGEIKGYVNDFSGKNLHITDLNGSTSATLNGSITGIPSIGMLMDIDIKNFSGTAEGLGTFVSGWVPGMTLDLKDIAPNDIFTFNGKVRGPLNRLMVDGLVNSPAGSATASITIRNMLDASRAVVIDGRARTFNLDIGRITGSETIGPVSIDAALATEFGKDALSVRIDSLKADRISLLGYNYSGIEAMGTYSNDAFDGRIICDDPNLNFILQGLFNLSGKTSNAAWQFYANVAYADLNALHIDHRGKSRVSFQTNANFMKVGNKDLIGEIRIASLVLENAAGRHNVGNISLQSHQNDNISRMHFDSKFADINFIGSDNIFRFPIDIQALTVNEEIPDIISGKKGKWSGANYEMTFNIHDCQEVLSFINPSIYISNGTHGRLTVDKNGLLNFDASSAALAFGDMFIGGLEIGIDNADGELHGNIGGENFRTGSMQINNMEGRLFADAGKLGLSVSFANDSDNRGEVVITALTSKDRSGNPALTARILPSNIYYRGEGWGINSEELYFSKNGIRVNKLEGKCSNQTISLGGGYSSTHNDTLKLSVGNVDISLMSGMLPADMNLKGFMSGNAALSSGAKSKIGLTADLSCDSTAISGHKIGTLAASSKWNDAKECFYFSVSNNFKGKKNINAIGTLRPSDGAIDISATLDSLDLGIADKMLAGVLNRFEGYASGSLAAKGTLNEPQLLPGTLRLHEVTAGLDFTNVAYILDGDISVDSKGLTFNNISIRDESAGRGSLNGTMTLEDMHLNANASFENMTAIALKKQPGSVFYGDIKGTGTLSLSGPFNNLMLSVNAITAGDGQLHVPLGQNSSTKSSNLLTFKEEEKVESKSESYESIMGKVRRKDDKSGSFGVNLRIVANPEVTVFVDIDEAASNYLYAQGTGEIVINAGSGAENDFSINGDYALSAGKCHVGLLGLVSRDFDIQDGSNIGFRGDIMDSDLNINAIYQLKTSLANLISDESAAATRRTVNCGIAITDKLRNPQLNLSIDIPDLNPTTKAQVESALNTEDKLQKQFLYLLISSSFLASEEAGVTTNNNNLLLSNFSNIMAGQLNNIFETLNIPVDLGLTYHETDLGTNIFDVALSTQLFNNRVTVNGTLGNKRYSSGGEASGTTMTTDDVVGDIDIDVKLNKTGTFRASAFSHSADQYTNYLDNSQRNGVGIAYQREFNSFKQFFRDLFTSSKKRNERILQEQLDAEMVKLQVDTTGTIK